MAERSQYQYQPVTGPVWREPVAEKLAWIPRDSYAGRPLPRALPRSYVLDPIPPADPRFLDFVPRDRYAGRPRPRAGTAPYVLEPYTPADLRLDWLPSGRGPLRGLPPRFLVPSAFAPFPQGQAFDPATLDWLTRDGYFGRALPRALPRSYVLDPFPRPFILDWLPWIAIAGKRLAAAFPDFTVRPAFQPAPFDPQNFPFSTLALVIRRGLVPPARPGFFVTDPTTPAPPVVTGTFTVTRRRNRRIP